MRRRRLFWICSISAIFGSIVHVACSSDDGAEHGPSFDGDDGSTGGDGKISSGSDGSTTNDDGSTVLPDGAIVCTAGSVAVVGGGSSASFAAEATGDQSLTAQAFTAHLVALPAIAAFGGGYQAVFHVGGSDQLESTGFSTATWTDLAPISGAFAREAPALAVSGSTLHLLYQANDDAGGGDGFKFFHGTLGGATWTAGDPMGVGADQSFGSHPPAGAGDSTALVAGQVGTNKSIYVRSYASSTWNPSSQIDDAGASELGSIDGNLGSRPRMIAMTGGTSDMMLVYTRDGDYKLMSFTRAAGVWSGPALLNVNAYTTEAFQLAALAGGKAIVAWRGADSHGYVSIFDGANWSTPNAAAPFSIESAPGVAIGNCGSVAMAAYAKSGGNVEVVRFDGTSWGTPAVVTGASGSSFVAIAATP